MQVKLSYIMSLTDAKKQGKQLENTLHSAL